MMTNFFINFKHFISQNIFPTIDTIFIALIIGLAIIVFVSIILLTNLYFTGHCIIIMIMTSIFISKNKSIYHWIVFIFGFNLQNLIYIHSVYIHNSWIYFVAAIVFCSALQFDNNKLRKDNGIEKFLFLLFNDPFIALSLLFVIYLSVWGLRYFLATSDIISIVTPCLSMNAFLDWACVIILIYYLVTVICIVWGYYNDKDFLIENYINCKSLSLCLLSICLGFMFSIYIIQPVFKTFILQFIKLEQFVYLVGLKVINKVHLLNELLFNCVKSYSIKSVVASYIRSNWVFNIWKFNNVYTHQKKVVKPIINIKNWATSMPKPILLDNKLMYFKNRHCYIRPTVVFEYVKKFSPKNSYFTSLNISNFTVKPSSTSNSHMIFNSNCNSLVKSTNLSQPMNKPKMLTEFIQKETDFIKYLSNNRLFVQDLGLNINKICNGYISRNPNTSSAPNVVQNIKNIRSLNYNIDIDLKSMFKLHEGIGSGIPITDFLCNVLSIYENKLRIGYLVASRLAFITYSFPDQPLDCFIMEKFKQDFGHLFAIDYIYVYYPYIPYFDCCIINGSHIVGHNLNPSLHTDNTLNFMFHGGQLDNVDHMSEHNVLLGKSYLDNYSTNMLMPLGDYDEFNKQFFKAFFGIYNLDIASKGMSFHHTDHNNLGVSNFKYTVEDRHSVRTGSLYNYTFIDVVHGHLPNQGDSWFVKNMMHWGRLIYLERFLDNCHSIFTDGSKILFAEYIKNDEFSYFKNGILHEKVLHPFMSWRNYANCNILNLKTNNRNHFQMLSMLHMSILFPHVYPEFYKRNPGVGQDIMEILQAADSANRNHFFMADLNDKNASYYVDHMLRCIFNTPSSLKGKVRQPYLCKYIFKPNFGSRVPSLWTIPTV